MTMMTNAEPRLAPTATLRSGAEVVALWSALIAVFFVALVMRHVLAAGTDVSWLLIAAERLIDGKRLYVDILETNPPMAVLTYVPAVLIGRALGVSAEVVTDGLILVAIATSLMLVSRILKYSSVGADVRQWPLLILGAAILAILPTQAFAQREHIAVIELLPALAVLALRANRDRPPLWAIGVAGLGLGLALSFKPYFALAILCCVGSLAVHQRNWRLLVAPEFFIAAAIIGIYAACTAIFFPDYFTIIGPLMRDVYLPIGVPFAQMLQRPAVPLWGAMLIVAMLLKRKPLDTTQLLPMTLSVGFGIVFLLQRKGWPYHSYPMLAFAMLALGYAVASRNTRATHGRGVTIGAMLLMVALFVQSMSWFDRAFDAGFLQAAVARLGPHPGILAISGEGGIGHPLTRAVGGTWASRHQMLLVAGYDAYARQQGTLEPAMAATLDRYAARERGWLIDDFRKAKPTVVLVDRLTGDWDAWMRESPELIDLMKGYRLAETVMDVDVYAKRSD